MASNEHVLDLELNAHEQTSGANGACLTRHVGQYQDKCSCSHRFQAYEHAMADKTLYNGDAYASLVNNPKFAKYKRPEKKGAWDLEKSSTVYRTDKSGKTNKLTVENFRQWATVPYWHNAHHVIPNSVLNGCLLDAAKNDMKIFILARKGLLDAKYNLNDKENMIILPMRKFVADAMCLPRHISGKDSEPGVKPEFMNHKKYNDNVRKEVEKVISEFADQISMEDHDVTLPAFTKAKLVKYSQKIYGELKVWGKKAKGMALSSMPDSHF